MAAFFVALSQLEAIITNDDPKFSEAEKTATVRRLYLLIRTLRVSAGLPARRH